ncbi:MAG: hypothetical protein ACI3XX_02595, partial [Eubacteriales bacterium]
IDNFNDKYDVNIYEILNFLQEGNTSVLAEDIIKNYDFKIVSVNDGKKKTYVYDSDTKLTAYYNDEKLANDAIENDDFETYKPYWYITGDNVPGYVFCYNVEYQYYSQGILYSKYDQYLPNRYTYDDGGAGQFLDDVFKEVDMAEFVSYGSDSITVRRKRYYDYTFYVEKIGGHYQLTKIEVTYTEKDALKYDLTLYLDNTVDFEPIPPYEK